jgi:hypothetical protein
MPSTTINYALLKPNVNDPTDEDLWGDQLNDDMDEIDTLLKQAIDWATVSKTASYTLVEDDRKRMILADATSASFVLTLPALSSVGVGYTTAIKKADTTANTVTIEGDGAEEIDGAADFVLTEPSQTVMLIAGSTQWEILSRTTVLEFATEAEIRAGINETKAINPANLYDALGVSSYFQSAEQSVTASGNISQAHGLSAKPRFVQAVLINKTAEYGYVAGDEIAFYNYYRAGAFGFGVWSNNTNIGIATVNTPEIYGKTNNTLSSITLSNWRWILRAWA